MRVKLVLAGAADQPDGDSAAGHGLSRPGTSGRGGFCQTKPVDDWRAFRVSVEASTLRHIDRLRLDVF